MRLNLFAAAATAVALVALPASAQDTQGQYAKDLQRMIEETASGECPGDLMANELLTACLQQMPQMSAALAGLGPVRSVAFQDVQSSDNGLLETYVVTFDNGATLNWGIGHMEDGKYKTAYVR